MISLSLNTNRAERFPDHLRSHLARARDNGVIEAEVVETITHLAFYADWPSAVSAVGVAREVFQKK